MGKRGPSIDDKMMGPEPNFHGVTFKNASEIKLAFSKSCHWFNYFFDAKKNVSVILKFAENEMGFKKKGGMVK